MISKKFKNIMSVVKLQKVNIRFLTFFEGLEMIISILLVYITQIMIDTASDIDLNSLFELLPFVIALIVLEVVFLRVYLLLNVKLKSNFSNNIRKELSKKELYCNLYGKNEKNSSHFITIYNTSVDLLTNYITNYSSIIIYPISLLVAIIYFISINPLLFCAAVVFMPASSYLHRKLSIPVQAKQKEIIKKRTDISNLAKDVVDGFYTVKSYQTEDYFQNKFIDEIEHSVKIEKDIYKILKVLQRIFILLRYIPQLIIPLLGGYMAYKGYITLGELVAATSIIFKIIVPVEKMLNIKKQNLMIIPACEDIEEVLSYETEQNNNIAYSDFGNEAKIPIQITDLTCCYDNKTIFSNVNLLLNQNEHVVLLGESGSGKSTLIKSIIGFLPNFHGEIKVMDIPVSQDTQSYIRKFISYVPQNPYMFRGTVAENIAMRFFDDVHEINEEIMSRIVNAASRAQAHNFIENLPKKYNTVINEDVKLSGGQEQRIAIARGIFRNCEIFLLDEPSSALDTENEFKFIEELHQILKDKSSIIITHRKEIIRKDDIVVRMEGGILSETV